MHKGFDSASTVTQGALDQARDAGVEFVCQYLKWLTPEVVRRISDAGFKIVSVFETTAKEALEGPDAGTADGYHALEQMRALGQPEGTAVYVAVDFGEEAVQDDVVASYLTNFRDELKGAYKMGVYGEGAVLQMALDRHLADYTWEAGGAAMRGSQAFTNPTIQQDVGDKLNLNLGIGVDSDHTEVDDYGGWSLASAAQPEQPVQQAPAVVEPVPPVPQSPPGPDNAGRPPGPRALQTFLRGRGDYHSPIDGRFGPQSQTALHNYFIRNPQG